MNSSNLKEKANNLPQVPGSYIFRNKTGKVIYVGKAKNLRSRVKSYFSLTLDGRSKTAELVKRINDIEFIKVSSEFEALILEAELIKKYKPKYNIVLKDDKSQLYIVIRNEKFSISGKKNLIPKVITARKTELTKLDKIYGPFPNSGTAKNILGIIRKVFPFRDCTFGKFSRYIKIKSPCLYGHIKLCQSPCVLNDEKSLIEYKKIVDGVKSVLSGNSQKIVNRVRKEMIRYSKESEFEKAAECRDLINKFSYITESFRDAEEYIVNPYLVDDLNKKSMEEIKSFIPDLKKIPERIECYDISNISGKEAVGSMVTAINGAIEKSEYKRFKIKRDVLNRRDERKGIKEGKVLEQPDDYGMMYEVLFRRLRRELKEDKNKTKSWGIPDLIIVDGGKPQVSAACEVIKELGIDVTVIGLAKKYETIVLKKDEDFIEKQIQKDNLGMKLIISLRDEAHRFAQSYHHLLRKKLIQK